MSKVFRNAGFWISVGLIVLIMLSYTIYVDDTGKAYNVFTAGAAYDTAGLLSRDIISQKAFYKMVNQSLPMYACMFSAMSFAWTLCHEENSSGRRYIIFRNGKLRYVLTKALAALVSSGLVYVIGAAVSICVCEIFLPSMSELKVIDPEGYELWFQARSTYSTGETIGLYKVLNENAFYIMQTVGLFLYGSFCGAVGFLVAAFCTNIYLAVCVPFFVGYMYYSIMAGTVLDYMATNISPKLVELLANYGMWQCYTNFPKYAEQFIANMVIYAVLWCIAVLVCRVRVGLSKDCGRKEDEGRFKGCF